MLWNPHIYSVIPDSEGSLPKHSPPARAGEACFFCSDGWPRLFYRIFQRKTRSSACVFSARVDCTQISVPPLLKWAWPSLPYLLCNIFEIMDEKSHSHTQNLGVIIDVSPFPIVPPNRSINFITHPSFALPLYYTTSVQAFVILVWTMTVASIVLPIFNIFSIFPGLYSSEEVISLKAQFETYSKCSSTHHLLFNKR